MEALAQQLQAHTEQLHGQMQLQQQTINEQKADIAALKINDGTTSAPYSVSAFKPKPPSVFNGSGSVNTFVFQMQESFRMFTTAPEQQVPLAASFVEDMAYVWFQSRAQSCVAEGLPDHGIWPDFERDLTAEFTPVNDSRHARDRLATLHQTDSMPEYITKFSSLAMLIPDL